ncbi:hypothetical protein Pla108_27800 [Botrimarina colliarenosi]|uniref:Uncharacterized protein n=1 Tax=Botrimarina colliarenosi TaxID=2528001 RepID=A0A5C6AFL0_9BACT|nr:hypothetical protein [Botrimarina colliarenosi]TWT97003.1 hypothetical protein Pla108_27800 [Botrimarina colliarenosi]
MWCRHCQQETPALGPPGANGPRCGRCQRTSPSASESQPTAATDDADDDGDEARRSIYRTLRSAHATISAGEAARTFRVDVAHTPLAEALAPPHHHAAPVKRPASVVRSTPTISAAYSTRGQLTAWLITSLGAGCLGLGMGLGAWSLVGGRSELWNPAVAAALGGQGLLIIGLLQLLSSLWNAARQAAGKLSQMHDELRRMRRTAEESASRNHPSAASFYADIARDASPEMLVGNLRGQLDHLASRLR